MAPFDGSYTTFYRSATEPLPVYSLEEISLTGKMYYVNAVNNNSSPAA